MSVLIGSHNLHMQGFPLHMELPIGFVEERGQCRYFNSRKYLQTFNKCVKGILQQLIKNNLTISSIFRSCCCKVQYDTPRASNLRSQDSPLGTECFDNKI